MARPRNEQEEERIYRTGFSVLVESGYKAASYQAIADASGKSRAFVQHYIKKKEQLLERFISVLLDEIDRWVLEHCDVHNVYVNFTLTGQLYFAFLTTKRMRPLAKDILSDRAISLVVIEANTAYQQQKANEAEIQQNKLLREIVRIIGGSYDLVYYCLCNDLSLDPLEESLHNVLNYARLVGEDVHKIADEARKAALSPSEVDDALATIMKRMTR